MDLASQLHIGLPHSPPGYVLDSFNYEQPDIPPGFQLTRHDKLVEQMSQFSPMLGEGGLGERGGFAPAASQELAADEDEESEELAVDEDEELEDEEAEYDESEFVKEAMPCNAIPFCTSTRPTGERRAFVDKHIAEAEIRKERSTFMADSVNQTEFCLADNDNPIGQDVVPEEHIDYITRLRAAALDFGHDLNNAKKQKVFMKLFNQFQVEMPGWKCCVGAQKFVPPRNETTYLHEDFAAYVGGASGYVLRGDQKLKFSDCLKALAMLGIPPVEGKRFANIDICDANLIKERYPGWNIKKNNMILISTEGRCLRFHVHSVPRMVGEKKTRPSCCRPCQTRLSPLTLVAARSRLSPFPLFCGRCACTHAISPESRPSHSPNSTDRVSAPVSLWCVPFGCYGTNQRTRVRS